LRRDEPVALATVVASAEAAPLGAKLLVGRDGEVLGNLGTTELDAVVGREAQGALVSGQSGLRHYGPHGEILRDEVSVFVEAFIPPPRMVILGAVDFSAALSAVANVLGYRVVVRPPGGLRDQSALPGRRRRGGRVAGPLLEPPRLYARLTRRGLHSHPRH
jgi:xanthine/CO dehydrogenase XdhC/CoxF family maturation factor